MSESKDKKQNHNKVIVFFILIAMIAIILYIFTNGRETHIKNSGNSYSIEILYCFNNNPAHSFFSDNNIIDNKHEIKITYRKNEANNISYTYTGVFSSKEKADNVNAILHAKYNTYMGQYNLSPTILGPVFSVVENKFKINLYASIDSINSIVSELFFLDSNEATKLKNESIDELKTLYINKGFQCKISNNQEEENE